MVTQVIDLKPLALTPEFVKTFKALGKTVGYRNLGRAIAYSKMPAATDTPIVGPNGNGHKAWSPKVSNHHWACNTKKRKAAGVNACACWRGGMTRAIDLTEWLRLPLTFYPSYRLPVGQDADHGYARRCQRVAHYLQTAKLSLEWHEPFSIIRPYSPLYGPPTCQRCCGAPMGIAPDFTDSTHWRYQCAVNPAHHKDVELVIWAKANV